MPSLYFHETCTSDVKNIIKNFRENKRSDEFINALIETYQLLFESPNSGHDLWDSQDFLTAEKKYISIPGFSYLIIFTKNSYNKIIVLGIVYCIKALTNK